MIDLEAIERRLNAATPGTWHLVEDVLVVCSVDRVHGYKIHNMSFPNCDSESRAAMHETYVKNSVFIARAPADIAALIAEVKRLQEAVIDLRDLIDSIDAKNAKP